MSKRKTVQLNMDFTVKRIKDICRSQIVFCEKMERGHNWVTEWKRNRNLPSPEEAARMCAILGTTPEKILVAQDDIDLVRAIIEKERPTPVSKSGPTYPPEYDLLTPEHKTIVDHLIAELAKSQSHD